MLFERCASAAEPSVPKSTVYTGWWCILTWWWWCVFLSGVWNHRTRAKEDWLAPPSGPDNPNRAPGYPWGNVCMLVLALAAAIAADARPSGLPLLFPLPASFGIWGRISHGSSVCCPSRTTNRVDIPETEWIYVYMYVIVLFHSN